MKLTIYFICFSIIFTTYDSIAQNNELLKNSELDFESTFTAKGYKKVVMTKMNSGHLRFPVTINGVKGDFILDTGAGGTFIEVKNKDKFDLATKNSDEKATGAGGSNLQMQVSEGNNLLIGDFALTERRVMLMSLDHVNIAFKQMGLDEVDGVMGADILTLGKAIIDYSNLTLYLKLP